MFANRLWMVTALLAVSSVAGADDFSESWGPSVGSTAPVIEAQDQAGTIRDLESLCGERGLLLVLSRSADW